MSIKSKEIAIKADNDITFNIVIKEKGESYGLNGVLTHDKDIPLIEFYDTRYPHTKYGQFISRYNADTILEGNNGLNLMGHEPDWSIDYASMDIIRNFLKNNEAILKVDMPKKLKM